MALIESYMLPLGTQSPSFSLPNVINNQIKELEIIRGKNGTLIIFMCNHCPYVIHLDAPIAFQEFMVMPSLIRC